MSDTNTPAADGDRNPLPRDEDGHIRCSAEFGECWIVEIEWSTDADGRVIDPTVEDYARTLHGTFDTVEEANEWIYAYPEDTDIHEMTPVLVNKVRS